MSRDKARRIALACAAAGAVIWIVGLVLTPERAWQGYLTAYSTILSMVLGAMLMIMTAHLTGARWFDGFRPLAMQVIRTVPLLALLFVPVLIGMHQVYPWIPPLNGISEEVRKNLATKAAWLNVPFFIVRAVVYLLLWVVVAELLRRWGRSSETEDPDAPNGVTSRERALSAIGLIVVGLTESFASFDWIMSLRPTWYSTVYGVYYFAGGFVAALALLAVLGAVAQRGGRLSRSISINDYHGLGNLILTMVIVWAYAGFSQLLIIWIGDLPVDAGWYAGRLHGGWGVVGIILLVGHGALPFLLLLFRDLKRRPRALAWVALLLVAMHLVDGYWLVMPEVHAAPPFPWLTAAGLLAIGGLGSWRALGT